MFKSGTAEVFAVVAFSVFILGNVALDPGVSIYNSPSIVIAQKNSPLLLNCSAKSSPGAGQVEIKWYKDGALVTADRFIDIRENGSLYFIQVKNNRNSRNKNRNHNGFYQCFLKNSYGTVIARQVQLMVARISKSFTIEPVDQEVYLGGVARFKCLIDRIPPPLYVWEKDSSYLPRNDRFIDLHSGILQIHNVSENDAGSYHCSAYQSLNKVNNVPNAFDLTLQHSREATLKVNKDTTLRPPKIIAYSKEVNATKDSSVILECLADGNPPPAVTWMKDQQPTVDGKFKESIGGSNLKFIAVDDKVDAGNYTCVASSPGFPDATAVTKLNVQVPPYMIEAPVSKSHPSARRFRLKCSVGGVPSPVVMWYKDGEMIESNGRMRINSDNELMIDSSASDSGYYQCIGRNDVGVVMATARLEITLDGTAPSPPENVTVMSVTSESVCLEWAPSAYQACCPVLAYTVHRKALTDVNMFDRKEIALQKNKCIDDLKPFTEYKFYVRPYSKNGAGPQSKSVIVKTLESEPDIAPNVRVSSTTTTSIDISWDKIPVEYRNGIITRYQVYVKTGDQEIKEELSSDNTSYTATGLKADTNYSVRVLACTSVGCPILKEESWPWQDIRTPKESRKSSVTLQLYVAQLNETCVNVQWNLTDVMKSTRSFKIYISKKVQHGDARVFEIFNLNRRSYTICQLETEKFYEVMFVADGAVNPLATVEEIFQTVPPEKNPLPPPPVNILANAVSSREIIVRWQPPSHKYNVQFYFVEYYRINNPSNVISIRSDTVEIVLTDLEPFTLYSIRVRSHTAQDHGIYSDPLEVKTLEDVPSAPQKLYIVRKEKDRVTLQWDPPSEQNGIITRYIILYNRQKDVPEKLWQSLEQNGTVTEATITGISDTNYYFKVGACTKQGQGHFSPTIEIKPLLCTISCGQEGTNVAPQEKGTSFLKDQRLGIIIGCSIGFSSIIICIVVVVVRQRHYSRMYREETGNGGHLGDRNCGQYLSNHNGGSTYNAVDEEAHVPMIQENTHLDAKGPDNTVSLQGNGQVIYLCNGKAPNGKIRAYVASPICNGQVEEQTGLITSKSTGFVSQRPDTITRSQSDGNFPQKQSEEFKKSHDIDSPTSTPDGASHGHSGSHGNNRHSDIRDLLTKMLQATTSNSVLPQRSGSKSGIAMETDLLSVDA